MKVAVGIDLLLDLSDEGIPKQGDLSEESDAGVAGERLGDSLKN